MAKKITVKITGYDPKLGKSVKDPTLDPPKNESLFPEEEDKAEEPKRKGYPD